ncbi:MAG: hypothetical protein JW957_03020 [Candidatus Omnitrophica bacterium]|nr:hypothetical protein [Candidatus Omnitrophota bacterium]
MNEIAGRIFGYSIIGFFTGIYLFFKGFSLLWRKRLIQNVPTSKVRSIAMGLVELQGKAIPNILLTAPYTKTLCVFYHIIIERLVRQKNSSRWVKEFEVKTDIPFFIQDDTGCVVLDPRGAETDLPLRYIRREGNKRYKEYNIIEKEPVYVMGTAKRGDSTGDKIHKEVEKRITEMMENPEEKQKLDVNKDMWIDEKEWETARGNIRKQVSEEFGRAGDEFQKKARLVPEYLKDVIIGKGELDKNFILSNKSEKELIENYKYKVFFYIFGGVVLTLACLGIILSNIVFKGR